VNVVVSCKAPTWCDCGDCAFWRRHRYYRSGVFGRRIYPWEPRAHVRAWRTVKRWARDYHPIALIRFVESTGWGDHDDGEWFHETPETRVAAMVLRRWETLVTLFYALFGAWSVYGAGECAWWARALYRLKAAICLVLGREPRTVSERCSCFAFTAWDIREYGTADGPGGSWEELQVGYGLGNWFAYVESESWP